MQSDKTGKCPPGEDSGDSPELKVVSAKEALRQNLRALEVPTGADVLFSPYEREFAGYFARVWDSPVAGIVKQWTQYVDLAQRAAISIALLSDITINRGAILRVDQSTKALLVGTIWIHRTGRLVYDGGYIKIWARAIENLIDITTRITATADIPWLVHTT
ncbi:MAG TPA: hypothetical protein VGN95_16055 [Pyrinomonadaceae bacterium]|jgi:hypothetical protein|nr:hypothetical protein [Pyrinomonadaceae bacterium]